MGESARLAGAVAAAGGLAGSAGGAGCVSARQSGDSSPMEAQRAVGRQRLPSIGSPGQSSSLPALPFERRQLPPLRSSGSRQLLRPQKEKKRSKKRRKAEEICRSGAHGARKNGQNQVPRRCGAPWNRLRALTRPPWSPALRAAGLGDRRGTPRYAGGTEHRPRASASAIALPLRATRVRPSLRRCASTVHTTCLAV